MTSEYKKSYHEKDSNIVYSREIKAFSFFFSLFMSSLFLVDLVRMMINDSAASIIRFVLYFSTALYSYYYHLKKFNRRENFYCLVFTFILISLVGLSYLINSSISIFLVSFLQQVILRMIPAVIYGANIGTMHSTKISKYFYYCITVWIVYAVLGTIYISNNSVSWGQYVSSFGFNLLLPFCFAIYVFFQKKRVIWGLLAVFFFVVIVLRGSRGALLCGVIFSVVFFIFNCSALKKNKKTYSNRFVFIVITGLLLAVFYDQIIELMVSLFPSSRTISLLSTNINFDSGRGQIWDLFLKDIIQHPLSIHGFFYDRINYSNKVGVPFDMSNYPHNIAIEICYQLGVVFGLLILIYLIVSVVKNFKNTLKMKDNFMLFLYLYIIVSSLLKLIFSGSYLNTYEFYLFVGFSFSFYSKRRSINA